MRITQRRGLSPIGITPQGSKKPVYLESQLEKVSVYVLKTKTGERQFPSKIDALREQYRIYYQSLHNNIASPANTYSESQHEVLQGIFKKLNNTSIAIKREYNHLHPV